VVTNHVLTCDHLSDLSNPASAHRSEEIQLLQLTKHHCLGNDFLVVLDEVNGPVSIGPDDARRLCDRHRGIGADGLVHGTAPDAARLLDVGDVDVVMHLFNADGSRAELSGNGIRCFGQAVADARGMSQGELRVATDAGAKRLRFHPGSSPAETEIAAEIGVARPGPEIPAPVSERLDGRLHATVDVGNPHLVVALDEPAELEMLDLASIGPELERAFPQGINIELVSAVNASTIELRVWERGVGLTEACGTGACAAVSQMSAWGRTGTDVEVRMPGGCARVTVDGVGQLILAGPSVRIARIAVPDA